MTSQIRVLGIWFFEFEAELFVFINIGLDHRYEIWRHVMFNGTLNWPVIRSRTTIQLWKAVILLFPKVYTIQNKIFFCVTQNNRASHKRIIVSFPNRDIILFETHLCERNKLRLKVILGRWRAPLAIVPTKPPSSCLLDLSESVSCFFSLSPVYGLWLFQPTTSQLDSVIVSSLEESQTEKLFMSMKSHRPSWVPLYSDIMVGL